jgi:hypothetical protein
VEADIQRSIDQVRSLETKLIGGLHHHTLIGSDQKTFFPSNVLSACPSAGFHFDPEVDQTTRTAPHQLGHNSIPLSCRLLHMVSESL